MKDISEHIKDVANNATIEETNKIQVAEALRLSKVLCGMFSTKQFNELIDIVRKPEKMADILLNGLKACKLLLEDDKPYGTLHMNVELDMYVAPRNIDEELSRLATKYGTEYLAEHLMGNSSTHRRPKHSIKLQRLRADASEDMSEGMSEGMSVDTSEDMSADTAATTDAADE